LAATPDALYCWLAKKHMIYSGILSLNLSRFWVYPLDVCVFQQPSLFEGQFGDQIYTHVTTKGVEQVKNPMEELDS
jgi:hypothetical protein